MRWADIDQQVCSVARTLAVVGDRWTLLILRDIFLGWRRFDDLQRQSGISRHRLADRLRKLVEQEVLSKKCYQQGPVRYEYQLTTKGLGLYPIMLSLAQWGDTWCDDGNGAPVEYRHRACGHKMKAQLACSECGEALTPATVTPLVGPGMHAVGHGEEALARNIERLPPLLRKSV